MNRRYHSKINAYLSKRFPQSEITIINGPWLRKYVHLLIPVMDENLDREDFARKAMKKIGRRFKLVSSSTVVRRHGSNHSGEILYDLHLRLVNPSGKNKKKRELKSKGQKQ